jgi:hypothetical protein
MKHPARIRLIAVCAGLGLATAACSADPGRDAETSAPSVVEQVVEQPAETSYPLTVDNCGYELTFDAPPERVLLLSGTSVAEVESFIVLGVQDHIVASSQSYGVSGDPAMVEAIAAVPTGGLTLNENSEVPREQVLALRPDLLISTWAGGFDDAIGSITREQLAEAGINSYVPPSNRAYGATDPRPQDQDAYANQSIESSFALLAELVGPDHAQGVQLDYEYAPQPPFPDAGDPATAPPTSSPTSAACMRWSSPPPGNATNTNRRSSPDPFLQQNQYAGNSLLPNTKPQPDTARAARATPNKLPTA